MNTMTTEGVKSGSSIDTEEAEDTGVLETQFQETLSAVLSNRAKLTSVEEEQYRVIFFSGAQAVLNVAPLARLATIQEEVEAELGEPEETPSVTL